MSMNHIVISLILFLIQLKVIKCSWPLPPNVTASFDCEMRKLAYEYGQYLLPRKGNFTELYNALFI